MKETGAVIRPRLRHFVLALCVPVLLVVLGTVGYRVVEGWTLGEALYMTVITITTVGFMFREPGGQIVAGPLSSILAVQLPRTR